MEHIVEIVQDIENDISMLRYHKYGSVNMDDLDFDYDCSYIDEMVEILTEGVGSILNFESTRQGWTDQEYELMVGLVDDQVDKVNQEIDAVNTVVMEHHLYSSLHPKIGPILGWSEDYGLFVWVRSGLFGYQSGGTAPLAAAAA